MWELSFSISKGQRNNWPRVRYIHVLRVRTVQFFCFYFLFKIRLTVWEKHVSP